MKNLKSKKIVQLLADLSKDKNIKLALDKVKSEYRNESQEKINSFKDLLIVIFKISSKFIGKKKARVIEETLDAVGILIQISFIVKTNVFDRPEVREYFQNLWKGLKVNWNAIYSSSKNFVDSQLKTNKEKSNISTQKNVA